MFDGCTKLDIVIDQNNTSFAEDESGILYNSTMTEVIDLMGDLEGEVVLPDSVTTIADGVFAGTGITKITLPAGVTEISANLFQNCENLTEVVILGRITTIGNYAFQNTALTNFTVGREVTAIGTYAFQGCDIAGDGDVRSQRNRYALSLRITHSRIARRLRRWSFPSVSETERTRPDMQATASTTMPLKAAPISRA